eukprot:366047-Chlamydomonas_euryale.AAC.1
MVQVSAPCRQSRLASDGDRPRASAKRQSDAARAIPSGSRLPARSYTSSAAATRRRACRGPNKRLIAQRRHRRSRGPPDARATHAAAAQPPTRPGCRFNEAGRQARLPWESACELIAARRTGA